MTTVCEGNCGATIYVFFDTRGGDGGSYLGSGWFVIHGTVSTGVKDCGSGLISVASRLVVYCGVGLVVVGRRAGRRGSLAVRRLGVVITWTVVVRSVTRAGTVARMTT